MSREKDSVYECEELNKDLGGQCIRTNDQHKCRHVYYRFLRTGVYQFDPISKKEKHFKLFKEDADFNSTSDRTDQFLWADDHYLIVSSTSLKSFKMEIHFFEIQKEGLKWLRSLQFNRSFHCSAESLLASHQIVLFAAPVICLSHIDTGKWLSADSGQGDLSLLRLLDEYSFLAIHDSAGIVRRWNILEDEFEKSWEFKDKALINYETKKSIHSDKIIILRAGANFLTVLDLATGQEISSISNPNGAERKITVLGKINDDQILLCDSDGACRHLDDMVIYNIRTERVDYRIKRDRFSSSALNPAVCKRFISLSPTQILVEGCGDAYLLSMEKNGVLTVSDFYSSDREYGLAHLVNLGGGYVFSASAHPARGNDDDAPPTVLIKLKNFNNAIQNNISSRTWMAIALACLIYRKELTLPLDLLVRILSFVQSGYETRYQVSRIGFFSHKLAICARDMVAKHFDGLSRATSAQSIVPKKIISNKFHF